MKFLFTIKQLIPAPEWFAVFVDYIDAGNPEDLTFIPLVAWSVMPDPDDKEDDIVRPMIYHFAGGVEPAEGDNFVGVVHASQRDDAESWIKRPAKNAS
ncbi:MAG: hypothetical protein WDN28_12885 [Chthoniobacter sp.]